MVRRRRQGAVSQTRKRAAPGAEGCDVLEKTEESEYGKFGWVMDPEGNKVELWQAPEGK